MIEPGKISAEEKTALLALVDAAGKRSNEIMEDAFDHDFNNAPMVMMAIANPPDGYQFAEKELLAKVASSELKQREVQGGLDMGRISSMIKADGGAISLGKKLAVHSCDGVTLKVVSMKKVTARQVMAVFV